MENTTQPTQQPIPNTSPSRLPLALLVLGSLLLVMALFYTFSMIITINSLYTLYEGLNVSIPYSKTQTYAMLFLIPLLPLVMTLYGFNLYRKQKHGIVVSTIQKRIAIILIVLPIIGWALALLLYALSAVRPMYSLINLVGGPSVSPAQKPDITISPTENPTANWETYNGGKFQFRYPNDWKLSSSKNLNTDILDVNLFPLIKKSHLGDNISINIHVNPNNLSIEQFVSTLVAGGPYHFKPIKINEIEALEPIDIPEATYVRRVYIKHYTYIYEIFIQSDAEDYHSTFGQILSTFKFLGQEQTSLNGFGSSTSNTFYNDTYFSVEVPTLLYASPQVNTKINGEYEVVTFANKLPYFSVQVTPDTPSMHNSSPSDKQILFGGFEAVLNPVIAGVKAHIYQPTVTFFTKGRAYVITVGIEDTKENREKADQFIQQLSKSFKVL